MKKYLSLLMIAALMASFSACKDDDHPGTDPEPLKKYNVEYKFEVNENNGNVKLVYYGPSLDKKEVENPDSPWQASLGDFKQGDSVYFHYEILPLANTNLVYSWEVNITGDGDTYFQSKNGSGDTQYLDTVPPVIGGWAYIIE